MGAIDLGSYKLNYLAVAGNVAALVLGIWGSARASPRPRADDQALRRPPPPNRPAATSTSTGPAPDSPISPSSPSREHGLHGPRDGCRPPGPAAPGLEHLRLDQRHRRFAGRPLVRQLPGGKIADFVKNEKQASWLFLAASILSLAVLLTEKQPEWLADHFLGGEGKALLARPSRFQNLNWATTR